MIAVIKLLRLCVAALLAASFLVSTVHAQKWVPLAPFPDPSEEVYGIASGGKLYVFGGLAPGWKPKALVYEYDPATNQWARKKNMPLASHHLAVAELNGKIYVMGGFKYPDSGKPAWQPIDNAWEYDPANDSWKALAPMPTKRGSPNAVVHGGKIYVIGGAGVHPGSKAVDIHPARPHRALSTNEVYDPATNTWETRQPMPTARNHAAASMVNNKIYVIGGRVGGGFITQGNNVDLVEEYDPLTDQWGALKARMPTARSAVAWGGTRARFTLQVARRTRSACLRRTGRSRHLIRRPTPGPYCRRCRSRVTGLRAISSGTGCTWSAGMCKPPSAGAIRRLTTITRLSCRSA